MVRRGVHMVVYPGGGVTGGVHMGVYMGAYTGMADTAKSNMD